MRIQRRAWPVLVPGIFLLFFSCLAGAREVPTGPVLNNGKKWRIAYLEGGPYDNYQGSLSSTIQSLVFMGWMEKLKIPEPSDADDTRILWEWLSGRNCSRYLEFVRDAYWSSGWDGKIRTRNAEQIRHRVNTRKDIDLFIAMGTWAGQDLVPVLDHTPVIVMSCSDPVKANIIKSEKDSGKDNVHAWCDPTRARRRLNLFHDIFGFRKLGLLYENTEEGKIYANLSALQGVSRHRGFRLITCQAPDAGQTREECRTAAETCIQELVPEIDAFMISDHRGLHVDHFPAILEPFFKNRIPVFTAVRGPDLVRRGALMGISRDDHLALGGFYAFTIAAVFNGSNPRDLPQIYQEPMKLAINLESARRIGYTVPVNVRKIADLVFETIDEGRPGGQ